MSFEYPKRNFINDKGHGEISNWDLTDETGSITMVAFNVNSRLMSEKLTVNRVRRNQLKKKHNLVYILDL